MKKQWFGYRLHVVADVTHELPISFRLTPASTSEHGVCRELAGDLIGSGLGGRCESFVADRGLDNDKLRK